MENANLLAAISVSGQLFTGRSNFLQSHIPLITYYSLFGQQCSSERLRFPAERSSTDAAGTGLGTRLYGDCRFWSTGTVT